MNLVEIPGITHVAGGDVLFTSLWYTVLLYTATGDIMKMKRDCKIKKNAHTHLNGSKSKKTYIELAMQKKNVTLAKQNRER